VRIEEDGFIGSLGDGGIFGEDIGEEGCGFDPAAPPAIIGLGGKFDWLAFADCGDWRKRTIVEEERGARFTGGREDMVARGDAAR